MENNFDNTPEDNGQIPSESVYTDPNAAVEADVDAGQVSSKPVYTDPNADVKEEDTAGNATAYQYTQSSASDSYAGYQQNTPNQSGQSNYSYQSGNYQYRNTQGGQGNNYQYQNGQNNNYQYQDGQNHSSQYQDNLDYNIGSNMGYNQNSYQNMDTSPMSMGDWLLTILAAMIPCAGLVLYLVWAFSSTGNINRRNFCRAQLIIMAVVFVLYLIIVVVFGVAFLSSGTSMY